jgi:hypothetical protein
MKTFTEDGRRVDHRTTNPRRQKTKNLVAKNDFNKGGSHRDKKKYSRKGYVIPESKSRLTGE